MRALSVSDFDDPLSSISWRRPLTIWADMEQEGDEFFSGEFPVEDFFCFEIDFLISSRTMRSAYCRGNLCACWYPDLVHFLAFGQLGNNWPAWRQEKHNFSPRFLFFVLQKNYFLCSCVLAFFHPIVDFKDFRAIPIVADRLQRSRFLHVWRKFT